MSWFKPKPKYRKTYNLPTSMPNMNKEQFISFLAGIIDGDGCIYDNSGYIQISIGMHRNWSSFLNKINDNIKLYYGECGTLHNYDKEYNIKISNSNGVSNMSYLRISKNKLIKSLKSDLNCLNLYTMDRK